MSLSHNNLRYGSTTHSKLLQAIRDRVGYSNSQFGSYHDRCRRDEDMYYAYVTPPSDESSSFEKSKRSGENSRPTYRTITIPYAYAIALTAHTYTSSVFMSRDPVFQVMGRHGETQDQELAMEACLSYHLHAGGMRPYLMNWMMDPFRYGAGIISTHWAEDYTTVGKIIELAEEEMGLYGKIFGSKRQFVEQRIRTYMGNRAYCVRPIDFIRDPRYSILDYQKGEYAGEFLTLDMASAEDLGKRGVYIKENVAKLKSLAPNKGQTMRKHGSNRQKEPDRESLFTACDSNSVRFSAEAVDFCWKIRPSEWGLGKSDSLIKYIFTVAEDEVILQARPMGNYHDRFPYNIMPLEVDAYKLASRSMMEIIEPLETAMGWLLNQHFYNVRKHLNNNGIIDPSKVVMQDLYTRPPGGYIRLRPSAYGQDPQSAFFQIPSTDITRAHLYDMRSMEEFAHRIVGVNDNVMGLVDPGGRKTAQETRISSSFATNRLKTQAEWFSATGFESLMQQMICNSQQFLTEGMKLSIGGSLLNRAIAQGQPPDQTYTNVTPERIAGMYDFVPVDGTLALDRMSIANMFRELIGQVSQIPQLAGQYDFLAAINHLGDLVGVHNLDRFRVKIAPNEVVQNQAQAGNIVPIKGEQTPGAGPGMRAVQ